MKRLLIMLAIFSVMITFAIVELIFLNKFYTTEIELLNIVHARFNEAPDNLDREETVEAFDKAFEQWKSGKRLVLMLSNHSSSKAIEEKLVSLKELIRMNQKSDAYITLMTAINYLNELKKDLLPLPSNFF